MAEAFPDLMSAVTEEQFNSLTYKGPNDDKPIRLKTIVFSTTDLKHVCKVMKKDEYGDLEDIDVLKMRDTYGISKKDIFKNTTIEEFRKEVSKMRIDLDLAQYDCFFFMFLTFSTEKNPDEMRFKDGSLSVYTVLDELKSIKNLNGKPKVILMQLDDSRIYHRDHKSKAFSIETRKIPVDADRLIILSTIPSLCARDLEDFDEKNPKGSLLVQAFLEVMEGNKRQPSDGQSDLLSLTTVMNVKMKMKIKQLEAKDGNKYKCYPPLPYAKVSSTFTKLLYL